MADPIDPTLCPYGCCICLEPPLLPLFLQRFFLFVTRSSHKNARFNRKCSRHPRKMQFATCDSQLHFFAPICAFWRQLDHGEEENTAEWDVCPNRQKALESEWEAKSATSNQFWYRTRGEAEIYAMMEVPGVLYVCLGKLEMRLQSVQTIAKSRCPSICSSPQEKNKQKKPTSSSDIDFL